jgi:uncharacterized protein YkwD
MRNDDNSARIASRFSNRHTHLPCLAAQQNGTSVLFLFSGTGLDFRPQSHQVLLPDMSTKTWFSLCGVTLLVSVGAPSLAPATDSYNASAERQLVQLINQARAQHGLPPLNEDARLQAAARTHSQLMASQNTLSHQLPSEPILLKRLALRGAYFYTAGETAAFNYTADAAQESFMRSPPHRTIILSPQYNAVGVGVVKCDGIVWVTEDFAHSLPP